MNIFKIHQDNLKPLNHAQVRYILTSLNRRLSHYTLANNSDKFIDINIIIVTICFSVIVIK